jgi:hypothetical protein
MFGHFVSGKSTSRLRMIASSKTSWAIGACEHRVQSTVRCHRLIVVHGLLLPGARSTQVTWTSAG